MIQKATLAGIILAGLVGLSGCSAAKVGMYNADEAGYKMALADTTATVDKAKKAGAEWRDIRWPNPVKKDGSINKKKAKSHAKTLFGKAEKAAKEGDFTTAIKLLNKAAKQAEVGMQQAESQKNAGPHS
ncbi:MAG: hypothetical protein OEY29_10515 [Gammaproteobacteria bacterium]|nr:hypothetical protein [Gammaproteobacteria bacterium]